MIAYAEIESKDGVLDRDIALVPMYTKDISPLSLPFIHLMCCHFQFGGKLITFADYKDAPAKQVSLLNYYLYLTVISTRADVRILIKVFLVSESFIL